MIARCLSAALVLAAAGCTAAGSTAPVAETPPAALSGPAAEAPAAPGYGGTGNWSIRETEVAGKRADVFYIHPTTFIADAWNMPVDDPEQRAWLDTSVRDRQVTAFAACCRRFMPYYRQASSRAFSLRDGIGAAAYEIAFADVRTAFREFASKDSGDRPFIVAGHSQGALLGLRLLQREIAGSPLQDRLIAAYLPGIGIPESALPAGIAPCDTPEQTRCVASWNAFLPDADVATWRVRAIADYGSGIAGDRIVCVNPLTFNTAVPAADSSASIGALPVAQKDAPPAPMIVEAVAARCVGGVLRAVPDAAFGAAPLGNGSLHMHEIALFWADLSANANIRTANWYARHP